MFWARAGYLCHPLAPQDPQHPSRWQLVCAGFPTGRVVGLDASQHLPMLLVASEDRWVRVWDYVRRVRVAARHMEDEQLLCCALHPSGLLAAVGTIEALHIFWILRVSTHATEGRSAQTATTSHFEGRLLFLFMPFT